MEQAFRLDVFLRSEAPKVCSRLFAKSLSQSIAPTRVWSDHQHRERVDGRFGKVPTMPMLLGEDTIALCLRRRDLMNSGRCTILFQIEHFRVTARTQEECGIGSANQTRRRSEQRVEPEAPLRDGLGRVHNVVLIEPFVNIQIKIAAVANRLTLNDL